MFKSLYISFGSITGSSSDSYSNCRFRFRIRFKLNCGTTSKSLAISFAPIKTSSKPFLRYSFRWVFQKTDMMFRFVILCLPSSLGKANLARNLKIPGICNLSFGKPKIVFHFSYENHLLFLLLPRARHKFLRFDILTMHSRFPLNFT